MNELTVVAPGDAGCAEEIARDEHNWLQSPRRLVCWPAVRLQWAQGMSLAEVGARFRLSQSNLRQRKLAETWAPGDVGWLAPLAPVLRRAIASRRARTGRNEDADLDAASCAIRGAAMASPLRPSPAPEAVVETSFEPVATVERWADIAHAGQLPPEGAWRTWLLMGGRGAGKTRAGAEWVRARVESGEAKRVALVGPSLHDVREVMVDGPSGLLAVASAGMRPKFEVTRRRLVWPEHGPCAGAVAMVFSAEDPESLRGPQFDAAWCDEIGAWAKDVKTWETLAFGLRLGTQPRIVATTTPRPRPLVKRLARRAEEGRGAVVMTRAATRANAVNLAPDFVAWLEEDYGGTQLGRQELDGELVEDLEGALWTRAMIERARCDPSEAAELERGVVAVDLPAGASGRSDACGIVAGGVKDGVVYVLADATVRGLRPAEWAKRVVAAAEAHGAGLVVAEANQGGEMVRDVLEAAGEGEVRVKLEHAHKGKRDRAEPVSAKYDQGRVRHPRVLRELEDEMCAFGAPGSDIRSPDRVDALVWVVAELTRKAAMPAIDLL